MRPWQALVVIQGICLFCSAAAAQPTPQPATVDVRPEQLQANLESYRTGNGPFEPANEGRFESMGTACKAKVSAILEPARLERGLIRVPFTLRIDAPTAAAFYCVAQRTLWMGTIDLTHLKVTVDGRAKGEMTGVHVVIPLNPSQLLPAPPNPFKEAAENRNGHIKVHRLHQAAGMRMAKMDTPKWLRTAVGILAESEFEDARIDLRPDAVRIAGTVPTTAHRDRLETIPWPAELTVAPSYRVATPGTP